MEKKEDSWILLRFKYRRKIWKRNRLVYVFNSELFFCLVFTNVIAKSRRAILGNVIVVCNNLGIIPEIPYPGYHKVFLFLFFF